MGASEEQGQRPASGRSQRLSLIQHQRARRFSCLVPTSSHPRAGVQTEHCLHPQRRWFHGWFRESVLLQEVLQKWKNQMHLSQRAFCCCCKPGAVRQNRGGEVKPAPASQRRLCFSQGGRGEEEPLRLPVPAPPSQLGSGLVAGHVDVCRVGPVTATKSTGSGSARLRFGGKPRPGSPLWQRLLSGCLEGTRLRRKQSIRGRREDPGWHSFGLSWTGQAAPPPWWPRCHGDTSPDPPRPQPEFPRMPCLFLAPLGSLSSLCLPCFCYIISPPGTGRRGGGTRRMPALSPRRPS